MLKFVRFFFCELSKRVGAGFGKEHRVEHLIREEGIYLFGGRNRRSEVLGTLYILKLGNKKNKNYWMEPKTLGKGPWHRYQHSMVNLANK